MTNSSNPIVDVHTTKERFEKIQCLIDAVQQVDNAYNETPRADPFVSHTLSNLRVLAEEAERCLEVLRYKEF